MRLKASQLVALALIAPLSLWAADVAKRPRIVGLAQVSLLAQDLEKSQAFYKEFLGFEEAFALKGSDGALGSVWIKINDRQTIELLPGQDAATDRLNHVSLEVDDAEAMRRYLAARHVKVPDTTARGKSGDFHFTVRDPDDHVVEFVQYAAEGGMRRDLGKFLPEARISARIPHVGILVGDLQQALTFYRGILGGAETWRGGANPNVLSWVNLKLPEGEDYLEFILYQTLPAPNKRRGTHHLCLEVPDIEKTKATLLERAARIGYTREIEIKTGVNRRRQINLFDPDGTRVEVMEPNTVDGVPVPSSTAPPPIAGRSATAAARDATDPQKRKL